MLVARIVFCLIAATAVLAQTDDIFQRLRRALAAGEGERASEALAKKNFTKVEEILAASKASNGVAQAELLSLGGAVEFLAGKMEAAVAAFQDAAKLAPLRDNDSFTLAMALVKLGDDARARAVLERLAQEHAGNAIYLYWLGRIDYDQRRYAEAAERLARVTELDPQSARAWDSLGLVFDMQGRLEQALSAFRKGANLNREQTHPSPWPPHNLGYLLLRMDRPTEAEAALRESLRDDPKLAQAHYHLGRALEKEGRAAEAIDEYASAVSLDTLSPEPCYSLAMLYRKLHRETDALAMFSEYKKRKEVAQRSGVDRDPGQAIGKLYFDVPGIVGRSDIFLGQPNVRADQAMPLGNGRLGVAVWSANGLSAQLNRADTLPARYSPGQVVIPGLSVLTSAKDYSGRLDLYNGAFQERGGGMTATAYVQADSDTLIIDVTGADPATPQTAELKLWAPRTPRASAEGKIGMLSQNWTDDRDPGASGRTFGSLAAITGQGRDVSAIVADPLTVRVTVTPDADGSFRIIAAAPHYDGKEDARSIATRMLLDLSPEPHRLWWNAFWRRAGLIKISSPDGSGEYMENLRNIYLFAAAASSGGEYPGSQAGVADMFSSIKDKHQWDPAAFWHWNLRMQVAANLGAGLPELNAPYFRLYRENLKNIENWTLQHMAGRPGVCVPETMRFNGQGIEYETWPEGGAPVTGLDCDAGSRPYYNARTLSTGAEVSLWVWGQYLATNDLKFLADNYPLMAASARFLLAYEKPGRDGLDHTSPSNAHETQWDTTDPTTDIAARMALYPATIQAAKLLDKDADLVERLDAALRLIPPFPRTHAGQREEVIADSYVPGATTHNYENIGLEPVWPYNLIGDTSPLFSLAKRTYMYRRYPTNQDWSFDPIQAARLGLGSEVSATLIKLTTRYQSFINGFANWGGNSGEFYIEQAAVVATALQEAIVQDYDGLIRIAPAIPPGWDFDGIVYVRANGKVYVQVRDGTPTILAIEAGSTQPLSFRNPWPGQAIDIVTAGVKIKSGAASSVITFPAKAGATYLIERSSPLPAHSTFAPASGVPASSAKKLGPVYIGLPIVN